MRNPESLKKGRSVFHHHVFDRTRVMAVSGLAVGLVFGLGVNASAFASASVGTIGAIGTAGMAAGEQAGKGTDHAGNNQYFQSKDVFDLEVAGNPQVSPDGKQVAYVSFETGRPAIFRQVVATAEREQLTNFKGLNGAPAWSPDGQKLAMVLSKDGNPEIYTLDLNTREFTRHTRHFAIDTEPTWTNDGKGIIFTSDRGGKPQIYQVTLASGRIERLTFEGDYNARARISPDGKTLVMVHRHNGVFHIATQDFLTGNIRILTETRLDESPSIAPNGAMLMYATKHRGKGILAAVSLDAGVKFRLPSKQGDVREPSWSPYF